MKRLFVFAASAMMVFASCTDHEIVYQNETPQEIGLFPVVNNMTRNVAGAQTAAGGFQHETMQVAAYLAGGTGVSTTGDYFDGTLFSGSSNTTFTGGKYWPIEAATLNFLAIAPSIAGSVVTTFGDELKNDARKYVDEKGNLLEEDATPIRTNYVGKATVKVSGNQTQQYDIMYAIGTKTKGSGTTPTTVDMTFKHALAWVNFSFKNTNIDADGDIISEIKVTDVKLYGAHYDGTLVVKTQNYEGTAGTTYSIDTDDTEWTSTTQFTTNEIPVPHTADLTLGKDLTGFGSGLLVAPATTPATKFEIYYDITANGETHSYVYTYNASTEANASDMQKLIWGMGKKYTYNISMGLQEIQINPSVENWPDNDDTTNSPNITIQ